MCLRRMLLCYIVLLFMKWSDAGRTETKPGALVVDMHVKLTVNDTTRTLSCVQNEKNLDKYLANILEGEKAQLIIEFGKKIDFIQCIGYETNDEYIPDQTLFNRSVAVSKEVHRGMDGLWKCTIRAYKGFKYEIHPLVEIGNETYAQVQCLLKVHVRTIESSLKLLVNNVVQPTVRNTNVHEPFDRSVQYNYTDGEEVEVFCFGTQGAFPNFELKYEYAESIHDMFKNEWKHGEGVGIRTTLRAQHHKTSLICKGVASKNQDVIKLTFVMYQLDNQINCKINGLITRGILQNSGKTTPKRYNLQYIARDVYINMDCNTKEGTELSEIPSETQEQRCDYKLLKKNDTSQSITMKPQRTCKIIMNAHPTSKPTEISIVTIQNTVDDKNMPEITPVIFLTMDISNYKPVMEFFKINFQRQIFYDYEDGDNITVTCSNRQPDGLFLSMRMDVNGKSEDCNGTVTKSMTLNSAFDNSTIECVTSQIDKKSDADEFYRSNKIVFRLKPLTTSSSTTTTSTTTTTTPSTYDRPTQEPSSFPEADPTEAPGNQPYLIAAVASVAGIVIIAVVIVMCRRRRNKPRVSGDLNYENLGCHSETSIPPHPPQWSRPQVEEYQVPADMMRTDDSIFYAQPVAEDPYATPLPKNLRPGKGKKSTEPTYAQIISPKGKNATSEPTYAQVNRPKGKNETSDPTYAELSLPNTGRPSNYAPSETSDYATVGELYSQVLPKSNRINNQNSYGNVFPDSRYVNSGNTEYVEPTYCQPHLKK